MANKTTTKKTTKTEPNQDLSEVLSLLQTMREENAKALKALEDENNKLKTEIEQMKKEQTEEALEGENNTVENLSTNAIEVANDRTDKLLETLVNRKMDREVTIVHNAEMFGGMSTYIKLSTMTIDFRKMGEQRVLKVWGKGKTEGEKGKGLNFVVLTDKAYLPIKNYLEAARKGAKAGEPLFTSTSHQNSGQQLTTRTISRICKDGLKAIGLDSREYTAHSLRHTTASSLLEHGQGISQVQQVLRHSSPITTQIYTKMKEKEIRLRNAPEAALDNAF